MVTPTRNIRQNPKTKNDGLQDNEFPLSDRLCNPVGSLLAKGKLSFKKLDGIADRRVFMFIRFRKL
jgi:hypothetical protein